MKFGEEEVVRKKKGSQNEVVLEKRECRKKDVKIMVGGKNLEVGEDPVEIREKKLNNAKGLLSSNAQSW